MNRKYYLDIGEMGAYFVRNGLILLEIVFFERHAVFVNRSMETHNSINLALKVSLRLCKFCIPQQTTDDRRTCLATSEPTK